MKNSKWSETDELTEWLNLVEISGPFLATTILEKIFPQGFEKIQTPTRQHLRAAHEEWQEAVDKKDKELVQLHQEWVRMVLEEALEYSHNEDLYDNDLPCYQSEKTGEIFQPDYVLRTDDGADLLFIKIFPPGTKLNDPSSKDWLASPVDRMTLLCRNEKQRVGLLTNGEEWILVNAPVENTTGYTTWYARLWWQEAITFKAFISLLGVRRFFGPTDDRIDALLERSLSEQQAVTDTLGEQVRRAVEILVQSLGKADEDRNGDLLRYVDPDDIYNAGLTVMMRLVFLLCAEERDLLLLGKSEKYDQYYAISTLLGQLREEADLHGPEILESRYDAWSRLLAMFRIIYGGVEHESLRLPAMGGSLFDPDRYPFLEGRLKGTSWKTDPAHPLPIDNRTVMLLLRSLQLLEHKKGALKLSYRGLDVEQIGHVYEGLLEYKVLRVPNLTVGLIGSAKVKRPTIFLSELNEIKPAKLEKLTGRSASAIKKGLNAEIDEATVLPSLVSACGGNETIAREILPFAALLRKDHWGIPVVYQQGSFAITLGEGRRESGSHYTPKSLTEPIVKTTLRPLLEAMVEAQENDLPLPLGDESKDGRGRAPLGAEAGWGLQGSSAVEGLQKNKLPLPLGDESKDGRGRATLGAEAEGWGEGIHKNLDEQKNKKVKPLTINKNGQANKKSPTPPLIGPKPHQLLALKICDPAMGSGAFLVEVCRQLADLLVEAWSREEKAGKHISINGKVYNETDDFEYLPADLSERVLIARRLVAEHCLYGVDKNPMAVELAKLSLWILTLSKNKPFGFLDHKLKYGDSLVGLTKEQIMAFTWEKEKSIQDDMVFDAFEKELKDSFDFRDTIHLQNDYESQKNVFLESEKKLEDVRLIGDLVIFDYLQSFDKKDDRINVRQLATEWLKGDLDAYSTIVELVDEMRDGEHPLPSFHWEIEFPEVFDEPTKGFDSIIGNPPFLGNKYWKGSLHPKTQKIGELLLGSKCGKIDLSLLFHRQAVELISDDGTYGLLGTANIAEGSSTKVGLGKIVENGSIFQAIKNFTWPGTANLMTCLVIFKKGKYVGQRILDGKNVDEIGPYLSKNKTYSPKILDALYAFAGVDNSKGLEAFVVEDKSPWYNQLRTEPNSLLKPYISGRDITDHTLLHCARWAIEVFDMELEDIEESHPVTFHFLQEAKSTRTEEELSPYKGLIDRWWQFWNHRKVNMNTIRKHEECIVYSKNAVHPAAMKGTVNSIYTNKVVVVANDRIDIQAILFSAFMMEWLIDQSGAKLGGSRLVLQVKAFKTVPIPEKTVSSLGIHAAERFQELIVEWSKNHSSGLRNFTFELGNAENEDALIVEARELLLTIDHEVALAYGFETKASLKRVMQPAHYMTKPRPVFVVSPEVRGEIIKFLKDLNEIRHQQQMEEKKSKPKKAAKKGMNKSQGKLF